MAPRSYSKVKNPKVVYFLMAQEELESLRSQKDLIFLKHTNKSIDDRLKSFDIN